VPTGSSDQLNRYNKKIGNYPAHIQHGDFGNMKKVHCRKFRYLTGYGIGKFVKFSFVPPIQRPKVPFQVVAQRNNIFGFSRRRIAQQYQDDRIN
jgi:hypothetical protein